MDEGTEGWRKRERKGEMEEWRKGEKEEERCDGWISCICLTTHTCVYADTSVEVLGRNVDMFRGDDSDDEKDDEVIEADEEGKGPVPRAFVLAMLWLVSVRASFSLLFMAMSAL